MTIKRRIKFFLIEILWFARGVFIKNPSLPAKAPKSILFICQGNIIRSVFAEKKAPLIAAKYGLHSIRFYSSGVTVKPGTPTPKLAVETARGFNVLLDQHRSRQLTVQLYEEYDMIVAMEAWHLKQMKKVFGHFEAKLFLLPLFRAQPASTRRFYHQYHIPDPYGKNRDDFESAFCMIETCLDSLFAQVSASAN